MKMKNKKPATRPLQEPYTCTCTCTCVVEGYVINRFKVLKHIIIPQTFNKLKHVFLGLHDKKVQLYNPYLLNL